MGTFAALHRPTRLAAPRAGVTPSRAGRSPSRRLALTVTTAGLAASLVLAGGTALASPASHIREGARGTVPYVAESRTRLLPNDALTVPSWWHGVCDSNAKTGNYPGSTPLGAVFDGLVA